MNKQKVVYLYNGIWFNHKKEWSSITCCNGNQPENITLGKISQSQEDHTSYDSVKMNVLVTQFSSVQLLSRVWLCNPMDYSTPGFLSTTNSRSLLRLKSIESVMPSNHLILCHPLFAQSCPILCARLLCPWYFPSKNTGVGCHSLLQGIFLTQGSNSDVPTLQADSLQPEPIKTGKFIEKASFQGLGGGRNIE